MATGYQSSVLSLIVGMFDAAPGASYLDEFTNALIGGANQAALAKSLSQTDAFKQLYSEGGSADEFATSFINTVVGDSASAENKAWAVDWATQKLNAGVSRSDVILQVVDALQKMSKDDANWGNTAQLFENKVLAAEQFSIVQKQSASRVEDLQAVVKDSTAEPPTADSLIVFSQDFDHRVSGSYTDEQIAEDMGIKLTTVQGNAKTNDLIAIDTVDGDQMLKVTLPAGEVQSGFQVYPELPQHYQQLYFSYNVRFQDGFDWKKGGKLPGFMGKAADSKNPSGGRELSEYDGFSLRGMYREDGKFVQYRYDTAVNGQDDELKVDGEVFKFKTGVTYKVEQFVSVNTPGVADGTVTTWVDGVQVLSENNYNLSPNGEYGISTLFVDVWAGGGDATSFAPSHNSVIWIDDLMVSKVPVAELPVSSEVILTGSTTLIDGSELAIF